MRDKIMINLLQIVQSILSGKKVQMSSFLQDRVRSIERDYRNGKIDISGIIERLKSDSVINLNFQRGDFEKIEKMLERE
ncbi:MAG: hypothetical protein A3J63_04355 [Candidatus Moranbacteria bacterium RIFCSPHIGHO2_02_FULL_40_12b]|nr:MAG: hypothetical protein A3J63_04355 [Candidatus Moranbacteria bacterium RIFCSPHIGHO2_02_FULL_40_12b]OGI23847.1 MAG: hypothetical protein A3E91_00435 [Candidatus Moranbacteria bacterium RIFCSPHIGHO2_12_FULL_40_10]